MNLEQILGKRAGYIRGKEALFPSSHILLSLLQGNVCAVDNEERIIMYMMYACTREGLSFSRNRKDFLFQQCMNQYENLEGRLSHTKGKLIMKSIELPLRAFDLYVKKEYGLAGKILLESIFIYNEIFEPTNSDIIWANLEQNLNLLRLYVDSGNVKQVIQNMPQIIDEYYIGIPHGLNNLSQKMADYIKNGNLSSDEKYHYINYLIDSLIKKITKMKSENNKEIINSLLDAVTDSAAYTHLKLLNQNSNDDLVFNEYYFFDVVIPKVMDLFILNKSGYYSQNSKNKKLIDDFLINAYNLKVES